MASLDNANKQWQQGPPRVLPRDNTVHQWTDSRPALLQHWSSYKRPSALFAKWQISRDTVRSFISGYPEYNIFHISPDCHSCLEYTVSIYLRTVTEMLYPPNISLVCHSYLECNVSIFSPDFHSFLYMECNVSIYPPNFHSCLYGVQCLQITLDCHSFLQKSARPPNMSALSLISL